MKRSALNYSRRNAASQENAFTVPRARIMNSEYWIRFLVFMVLSLPFSIWIRRMGFVRWERVILNIIFVVVFFLTWDLLRGRLI
ncbi:hypothetical protein GCM10008955_18520 [Deinococcus malanensis]|uniref:Uncharacterized protein n=2 Tax=Deinococcus malanensis TaxID=1706855 RepID=A0ABQ2EUC9_9DEIO|nr:hypothetical protein GCM10008955_18520 [Deinococcus malanensis]